MSINPFWLNPPENSQLRSVTNTRCKVVLTVCDHDDALTSVRPYFEKHGYLAIDTDNGRDAEIAAIHMPPDLLLVDLDVPLIYGVIAARQIIKHSRLDAMPSVIINRDDHSSPALFAELGVRHNEFVIGISNFVQLERLLTYLSPD